MNKLSKASLIVASLISSALIFTHVALAQSPTSLPGQGATRSGAVRQNSNASQARSCQVIGEALARRSQSLVDMANNNLEKFDSISQRVQEFYNSKVVPSGSTAPGYDSLVSTIASNSAAVQTALDKAEQDLAAFDCEGSNPKEQMMLFRKDMQTVKEALQVYRISIKNLIVAVHSVNAGENQGGPSRTPRPTRIPNTNRGGNR